MKRHSPDRLADLVPILRSHLQDVSFAFLTGSAAEGLAFRDLDVAVYLAEPNHDLLGQVHGLATRLEHATGVQVDVIPLQKAPLGFCHHASKGLLLHCGNEELLARWREDTWGRYLEMEPHFRVATRDLLSPGPRP